MDFWKQQIAKLGSKPLTDSYGAYLWTPYRASNVADFYWVGASPDLLTLTAGGKDYVTSAGGTAADAQFDEVASCSSGLWMEYWIVQQEG